MSLTNPLTRSGRHSIRCLSRDAYLDRDAVLVAALNRSMLRRGAKYSEKNFLTRDCWFCRDKRGLIGLADEV